VPWDELKAARRAKGLCLDCGRSPKQQNSDRCVSCLGKRRITRRLKYSKRLEQGLCPECGGERDISPRDIFCRECLRKATIRNANYVPDRLEAAKRARKFRNKRRKERQCQGCGQQLGESKYRSCLRCRRRKYQPRVAVG